MYNMYVCLYVCMYGGHSVLHSNSNYVTTSVKCKQVPTHHHTVQCHACNTPSQALSTRILGARILLRRKGKVSLMTKRNTESVEIEKRLKKGIAGDFLCTDEEMLFVDSKVS